MFESIDINLKRASLIVADELSYSQAAERLKISPGELRKQITALETQLCLHIFRPKQKKVELTEEGKFLIKAFREAVSLHDRNISKGGRDT